MYLHAGNKISDEELSMILNKCNKLEVLRLAGIADDAYFIYIYIYIFCNVGCGFGPNSAKDFANGLCAFLSLRELDIKGDFPNLHCSLTCFYSC